MLCNLVECPLGFDSLNPWGRIMAKILIFKKDGAPSPYFWSDRDADKRNNVTVYKNTEQGVKRMTGVRFNPATNRMRRDQI